MFGFSHRNEDSEICSGHPWRTLGWMASGLILDPERRCLRIVADTQCSLVDGCRYCYFNGDGGSHIPFYNSQTIEKMTPRGWSPFSHFLLQGEHLLVLDLQQMAFPLRRFPDHLTPNQLSLFSLGLTHRAVNLQPWCHLVLSSEWQVSV